MPAERAARAASGLEEAFINRRRSVWLSIGLAYASYYMCRYNWGVAAKAVGDDLHFSNAQLGWIFTATMWSYAFGQLVNGPLCDRWGGKRAILIGAAGTIVFNLALAWGSEVRLLGYFVAVGALNGYFQAFGSPALIKVNASWLRRSERGTFTALFGLIIQVGRWATTALGGWLIARGPWFYAFLVPPIVTGLMAILTWATVVDNPEDEGLPSVEPDEPATRGSVLEALRAVAASRPLWFIAGAYFCVGVVRQGLDAWYVKYLQEAHGLRLDSMAFQLIAIGVPVAAVAGTFVAGLSSDRLFGTRRGPVAALMFFGQVACLLLLARADGIAVSIALLLGAQFFVNGPHALLGGAGAMDFGGRRGTGAAAGLVDAFQYVGAGLAGIYLGRLLDSFGWSVWAVSLVGFALLGALQMCAIWRALPGDQPPKT